MPERYTSPSERAGERAKDLYELLEVSPGASREVIQAAYKVLARVWHPDLNKSPEAAHRIRDLNAAYHVLSDTRLRATYDLQRARLRRRQQLIDAPDQRSDAQRRAQQSPERAAAAGSSGRVLRLSARRSAPPSAEEGRSFLSPRLLLVVAVLAALVAAIGLLIWVGMALSDEPRIGGSLFSVQDTGPIIEYRPN